MKLCITITITLCALLYFSGPAFAEEEEPDPPVFTGGYHFLRRRRTSPPYFPGPYPPGLPGPREERGFVRLGRMSPPYFPGPYPPGLPGPREERGFVRLGRMSPPYFPGPSNPQATCDYYFSNRYSCTNEDPICATDDRTYDNICDFCDMREESGLNSIWIRFYGRCKRT